MFVKFDKPTKGINGKLNNTGSSSAFVNYLRKNNRKNGFHILVTNATLQKFGQPLTAITRALAGMKASLPQEASILPSRSGKPWEIRKRNE